MTVAEFKQELESFLAALDEHHQLWRRSLNNLVPGLPVKNTAKLREQALRLSRHLGRLRPYIERFMPPANWVMHVPLSGSRWNALDMAVSANAVAQIKGASIRSVTEQLHQLLGRLDGMMLTQDLNRASTAKPRSLEAPASVALPKPSSPAPTPPTSSVSPMPPASPANPHALPVATNEPVTLERVSLRDLLSALGRFSIGTWGTILSVLAALIGAAITVTRAVDQHAIDALRDSVRVQQRVIDAERLRRDSLAALLHRPQTRKTR